MKLTPGCAVIADIQRDIAYREIRAEAQARANREGVSLIVYEALVAQGRPETKFGIADTLPTWGVPVGDRIYPAQEVERPYNFRVDDVMYREEK